MFHKLILCLFLVLLNSCEESNEVLIEEFTITKDVISIDGSDYKIDCNFNSDSIFYSKLIMATLLKSNPMIEITILDSINFGALAFLENNLKKIGVDSLYYKINNKTLPRGLRIENQEYHLENYTDIYIHPSFFELRRDNYVIDYIKPNHLIPLLFVFDLDNCEPTNELKLSVTDLSYNHTSNFSDTILELLLNKHVSKLMGNLEFKSNFQCKGEEFDYQKANSKHYLDSSWFRGARIHTDTLILKLDKFISQ